jgi:hypothetical protein
LTDISALQDIATKAASEADEMRDKIEQLAVVYSTRVGLAKAAFDLHRIGNQLLEMHRLTSGQR